MRVFEKDTGASKNNNNKEELCLGLTKHRRSMKQDRLNTVKTIFAVLACVVLNASAQNISTGPNKVYLEQIGDSNTITIEQVGGTNNVGGTGGNVSVSQTGVTTLTPDQPSSSNYATVNGSSNQVNVTQTGDNNSAQYNIRGSNNNYTSTVTGDNNQTNLTVGTGNTASSYNTITESITGSNNLIIQNVTGGNVTSNVSITGSTNQVTTDLKSARGNSTISISGGNNVITAEQTDAAGAGGHVLINTVSGSYNSITTQQQGTNDTTINLSTTGDHNTVTVRQSNATIVNPKTAIAR